MLWPVILLSAATFDLDPAWKPARDPLIDARAGKIQCHDADPAGAHLPHHDLARRGRGRPGTGAATDRAQRQPRAGGRAADGRDARRRGLCGVVNETYMASFRIVSSRAPHAPLNDKRYSILYRDALVATLWNRKTCAYAYSRAEDDLQLEVGTVDGQFAGEMMSNYIWISPGAGYRLKARPPA